MIFNDNPQDIESVAQLLLEGEIVAIPTETVYGLAGDALNPEAIAKIYRLKGRPSNNPLIVHVLNREQSLKILALSEWQNKIFEVLTTAFWPGPLSIVLPCNPKIVPNTVRANLDSIAVRSPAHPVARKILEASNLFLAAPSANPSGYISSTKAEHVLRSFAEKSPALVDAGSCDLGIESTILSLLNDEIKILRAGCISTEEINSVLASSSISIKATYESNLKSDTLAPNTLATKIEAPTILAPGMLKSHYAPKAKVMFLEEFSKNTLPCSKLCQIKFNAASNWLKAASLRIDLASQNHHYIARELFSALHQADQENCDLIVTDKLEGAGIAVAIMDRLLRAMAPTETVS